MMDTGELFDSRELQAQRSFTSRDMLRILFKHKWPILVCFLGVTILVAAAMRGLPPTYIADGKILIVTERQGNPSFLSGITAYREQPQGDPVNRKMETEMQLLSVREIAERVVRDLEIHYDQVYRKPYQVLLDPVVALYDRIMQEFFGYPPDPEARGFRDTVDAFGRSYIIEPVRSKSADTTSNVIAVKLKAFDPEIVQRGVRALMATYIDYAAEQNRIEGQDAYELVSAQRQKALNELVQAEKALQDFLANRTVSINDLDSDSSDATPSQLAPGRRSVVGTLKSRLVDMQLRLDEMRQTYRDEDENVRKLRSSISDLERRMALEMTASAEAEANLATLERSRKMAESYYQDLVQKQDQIALYLELSRAEADTRRIVEMPQQPESSEWKKDLLIVVLSSIAGMMLGLGVAGYREYTDHRLQSSEDLQHHLGLSALAVVPELRVAELATFVTPRAASHSST